MRRGMQNTSGAGAALRPGARGAPGRRRARAAALAALLLALLLAAALDHETAGAQDAEPLCRADLVVVRGEPCLYPGTEHRFAVDRLGRGRFLFFSDAAAISVPGLRVDGQRIHLAAHAQGDGSWLIASAGEPPQDAGVPAPEPEPGEGAFAWTVTRDLGALAEGHGTPTGLWGDGATLWLLENATVEGDALYGYALEDPGEEATLIALAPENALPRGVWSDGETLWVADSGSGRVFAYDAASGEREEGREFALAEANAGARGIWSDGETLWALDAASGALFAYDLRTGAPLGRRALDPENASPHGLWSDGATAWVSDHAQARLFAYRLPPAPAGAGELERAPGDDFLALGEAGNESPRGIWSDGALMYVADANDDRVYSYHMPPAAQPATGEGGPSPDPSETPAGDAEGDDDDAEGWPRCLRGELREQGFSLVVYEGGSVDDLAACAQGLGVTALYALDGGEWVSYIADAPAFVNRPFGELFAGGLPALTPLLVTTAQPSPADPVEEPAEGTAEESGDAPAEDDAGEDDAGGAGDGRGSATVIANTGGIGVSHRHDCADGARLPRFGWAEGDAVEVLAEGAGRCAGWLRVEADGIASWVREQYVSGFAGALPDTPRRISRVIANTGGIGVSHRTDCADGARLPRFGWAEGDAVEVLARGHGRCAGWLLARADGVASWVREQYLTAP